MCTALWDQSSTSSSSAVPATTTAAALWWCSSSAVYGNSATPLPPPPKAPVRAAGTPRRQFDQQPALLLLFVSYPHCPAVVTIGTCYFAVTTDQSHTASLSLTVFQFGPAGQSAAEPISIELVSRCFDLIPTNASCFTSSLPVWFGFFFSSHRFHKLLHHLHHHHHHLRRRHRHYHPHQRSAIYFKHIIICSLKRKESSDRCFVSTDTFCAAFLRSTSLLAEFSCFTLLLPLPPSPPF